MGALCDGKSGATVPYRDSKLTRLLQVFFWGGGAGRSQVCMGQGTGGVHVSGAPKLFHRSRAGEGGQEGCEIV
eukprot:351964-Chlamydomonas_euryale.AAC.1